MLPTPSDRSPVEPTMLRAEGMSLAYDEKTVVHEVDLSIAPGSLTVLIGPNGSGKSTALRGLAGMLKPRNGRVSWRGRPLDSIPPRERARRLSMLPQSPIAPPSTSVAELVAKGRAPYQSLLRQRSVEDDAVIAAALEATSTLELSRRTVESLSGGQRQRVWIAMALAQNTEMLLLDEPTTFLDLSHQIEILDLCRDLRAAGRTLVLVLHDMNLAARYADRLIAFDAGRVVASGTPDQVLRSEMLRDVLGLDGRVVPDPTTGTPMVVPSAPRKARNSLPLPTPTLDGEERS